MNRQEAFIKSGYEDHRAVWGKGMIILYKDDDGSIWVDNPDDPENPLFIPWAEWEDGIPFHFGPTYSVFLDAHGDRIHPYPPDILLWRERCTGVPITAYTHVRREWPHFEIDYPDLVFDEAGRLLYKSGRILQLEDGFWWYTTMFGGPEGYEDIPLHRVWPVETKEVGQV